jgi:large subunit ribosomal protein L11
MAGRVKVASKFRLVVPAGKATPQPPVGSALGQRGLKLMDFCKDFNAQTAHLVENTPIPCQVTAMTDRTFTFQWFQPHTSFFLKRAAGLEKGSQRPGHATVGRVTVQHIYEIAALKKQDFEKKGKEISMQTLCRSIAGSARSMGIAVYNPDEEARAHEASAGAGAGGDDGVGEGAGAET